METAMRPVTALIVTLSLSAVIAGCGKQQTRETPAQKTASEQVREALAAKHAQEEAVRSERRAAAGEGKLASVNTICPVTGHPVDPAIPPVTVEVMIVQPPEVIAIGVADEAAAEAVRHDPDRFAAAARANRQARRASEPLP
jgi:hypothetical protein